MPFERMIFEGEKFGDSVVNVLREIAVEMVRVMTIRPAAQAMAGGLSSMFGGLFGQTTMAPTTISPALAAGPADAWLDTLPHYGDGGFAARPHVAVVGEVPELITPISKLGQGGSTAPVTNIYNYSTAQVNQQKTETFFDGRHWVVNVVVEDSHNNGPIRKLIGNKL